MSLFDRTLSPSEGNMEKKFMYFHFNFENDNPIFGFWMNNCPFLPFLLMENPQGIFSFFNHDMNLLIENPQGIFSFFNHDMNLLIGEMKSFNLTSSPAGGLRKSKFNVEFYFDFIKN